MTDNEIRRGLGGEVIKAAEFVAGMTHVPHRAYRLTLELEADSLRHLASALFNLATDAEREELSTSRVSGGYSSGYVMSLDHNEAQTGDKYRAELLAYVASLK